MSVRLKLGLGILFLLGIFIAYMGNVFFSPPAETMTLDVYIHRTGEVETMELEEYLIGVVAAEMPVIYNREALKAQAVAARTYVLQQMISDNNNHNLKAADITTDFRYNQAWISRAEMREKWGVLPYFYFYQRIAGVVEETVGEVIVYQDEIIDAVYHSNSGGQTTASETVWGQAIPYLRSVCSPYDKLRDRNYSHQFEFTSKRMIDSLGLESFSEGKIENLQLKIKNRDQSGRVQKMEIAGFSFTGQEIRQKLNLPSTKFDFKQTGEKIICQVIGFGHGVGMSQDGADGFARNGHQYDQILTHYYQGTRIVDYRTLALSL